MKKHLLLIYCLMSSMFILFPISKANLSKEMFSSTENITKIERFEMNGVKK